MLKRLSGLMAVAMIAGCAYQDPGSAPYYPAPIEVIRVLPLVAGKNEKPGFEMYTYLVSTGRDAAGLSGAICGFIYSEMAPPGIANRKAGSEAAAAAAYYIPQLRNPPDNELKPILQNYDYARARSITARLSLPDGGLYLVSYVHEPLPRADAIDRSQLDIVSLTSLSPVLAYKYTLEYRERLVRGGPNWKARSGREWAIRVAQTLSLVVDVKDLVVYLGSPDASEAGIDERVDRRLTVPESCGYFAP